MIPQDKWKWYGTVGHFICGQWCRFHLTTKVGPWLISTLGEYVHPRHGMGSELKEAEWLSANFPGENIGCDRKYETMVFVAGKPCGCGCGLPTTDGNEKHFKGYNDAKSAREGHMKLCRKFAKKSLPSKKE